MIMFIASIFLPVLPALCAAFVFKKTTELELERAISHERVLIASLSREIEKLRIDLYSTKAALGKKEKYLGKVIYLKNRVKEQK